MHISFVSSALENSPYLKVLQGLNEVTIHAATRLDGLHSRNVLLDLVFFDAALGMDAIAQQVQSYQQTNTPLKWLVINTTGITDIQQSLQYLLMGASGILTQLCEKTLQDCFQSIAKGQLYLEADLIQILALRQIKKTLLPFSQLTAREYDVFCLLAEDYSIQAIAELLLISTKTAFNCQAQVRKKLALKNRQQLSKLAKKHGLVH